MRVLIGGSIADHQSHSHHNIDLLTSTDDQDSKIGNSAALDTHSSDRSTCSVSQSRPENQLTCSNTSPLTSSDHDVNTTSHSVTLPPISNSTVDHSDNTSTSNLRAASEAESAHHKDQDGITLPSIPAKDNIALHGVSKPEDVPSTPLPSIVNDNHQNANSTHQLSILQNLEQTICSESEESGKDSSDESSSDEERNEDSDSSTESAKPPNLPDLQGVTELSLPTILHYMRESESMASRYFSLQNRAEVDRRTKEAKLGTCHENEEHISNEAKNQEERDGEASTRVEEDSEVVCHFCGKNLPRRTLLADSHDIDKIKEEVTHAIPPFLLLPLLLPSRSSITFYTSLCRTISAVLSTRSTQSWWPCA